MEPASPAELPRLLYAGDVSVQASVGGSLLLHRLLTDYPPERLEIWESSAQASPVEKRLPRVTYREFPIGHHWLMRSRLRREYSTWLLLTAVRHARTVAAAARQFGAEAILTVSHGYGWLAAAAAARTLGLPLHLIAHDDWLATILVPKLFRGWAQSRFCKVYRQAASRLCVSPYMAQQYQRDCAADGEVIYPSRAPVG